MTFNDDNEDKTVKVVKKVKRAHKLSSGVRIVCSKPLDLDFESIANTTPLKRVATPEDIVGPVLFLLEDASRYMTGQVLWVNGGSYMP